jgi:hypothetical protein
MTHINRHDDIDEQLRDYFTSELPDPWPACPTPYERPARPTLFSATRWVVAASIALLLAGYLMLAGFFPRETSRLDQNPGRDIGMKKGVGQQP